MGLFNWLTGSGEESEEAGDAAGLARLEIRIDTLLRALDMRAEEINGESGSLPSHIQSLVNSNRKIEAIKAYREEFGVGLKEAKDAIDGVAPSMPSIVRMERKLDAVLALLGRGGAPEPDQPDSDTPYGGGDTSEIEQEMLGEIRARRKINAIKLYRDLHPKVGLKEAKDAVDALEAEMRRNGELR